ncbi:MAG: ABC transporter permease [Deinococcota bacterium]
MPSSPATTLQLKRPQRHISTRLATWVRRYNIALVAGFIFTSIVICTLAAPLLTPYDPSEMVLVNRFQPPSLAHPFGTDDFGRDVLSRVLYGGRTILLTGFSSVIISLTVGGSIGLVAAYWGSLTDDILMRVMDIVLSFPSVLLAILIVAALGPGLSNALIAITASMIPVFARLTRSIVVSLVQEEYVLAARALGAPTNRILAAHILPNMLPPMIVQASAMLAVAIGTSTALNFLGLGVEPPIPDWGLMVSDGQRLIFDAPHVPFFPGIVITITVLSVNFIGDGLRDHLDPKLRGLG